MGRVLFALAVFTCAFAAFVGAVGRSPGVALACTLGPFRAELLADSARQAEVVAIGTYGQAHGAAIELQVEEYYKAPASNAGVLLVNNLTHTTTPACQPIPLRVLAFDPGTRVVALLKRDQEGIGANWVAGFHNLSPIVDDSVLSYDLSAERFEPKKVSLEEVRQRLSQAGTATKPDPTRVELPSPVVDPRTCLHGPHTVEHFASTASVIALGTVEQADDRAMSLRVVEGFLGAQAGEAIRIDNRGFTGGAANCVEQVARGPNHKQGDRLLVFLREQDASEITGLRGVSVDGAGILYAQDQQNDVWSLLNGGTTIGLDEAREVIRRAVAARPATRDTEPRTTPEAAASVTVRHDDRTPVWAVALVAAGAGAVAGGGVAWGVRRR